MSRVPAGRRPLVSVVIPTYNRAALLRQTIDSVLAQTYAPVEVIVVDDGSTDGTPALLASYGDRIVTLRQENRGGTAARNAGTRAARGEYLNWLDHDDLFAPAKLERQVAVLERRPDVGLVHCGYDRIDADGRLIDWITGLPEGDVRARLVCGCFVWSGAPLVRRVCLDGVGLFDESVWSSDADLWLRIALAGHRFGCVQERLGSYRILPDSSMADVARTERLDVPILDRIFADPALPPQVAAQRRTAYFNQRFWLATRYYAIGDWAAAERNFTMALDLDPALARDPVALLFWLSGSAADPRVPDPLTYVDDVLAHLPARIAALRAYRPRLRSQVRIRGALRAYARGDVDGGRRELALACRERPALFEELDDVGIPLHELARRMGLPERELVDRVVRNLPPEAERLGGRPGTLGGRIVLVSALRDWWAGARRPALAQAVRAVRLDPRLLPWLARFAARRGLARGRRRVASAVARAAVRARGRARSPDGTERSRGGAPLPEA